MICTDDRLAKLLADAKYVGDAATGDERRGWMQCLDYIESLADLYGRLDAVTEASRNGEDGAPLSPPQVRLLVGLVNDVEMLKADVERMQRKEADREATRFFRRFWAVAAGVFALGMGLAAWLSP